MRSIKHIALSILVTLSVFGAVLYTSCTKEACKGVTCINGGTCGGGTCTCPTGIGGNNCQTIYRMLYDKNTYGGFATYTNKYVVHDTVLVDSTYVIATDTGNILTFNATPDSNYAKMNMSWGRGLLPGGSATIFLTKNSTTGSSFTVSDFTIDSFNCTGTGNISATSASVNLIAKAPHTPAITITLSNFSKQ